MKLHSLLIVAMLLGACDSSSVPDSSETPRPQLTEEQVSYLETMVADFVREEGYPNLAIGLVMGGELVWSTGHGAGASPGVRSDENTLFRAVSVTALVTATAVMQLVEDGKLTLEDEAARWLPEATATLAPEGRPAVTLRHLLSHRSGIPSDGNGTADWMRPGPPLSESDLLGALEGVALQFDPGTDYAYSVLGTALAGVVVSRASGESYRSFVQRRIFDPLGMSASVWDPPSAGLAPGHVPAGRGGYERATATSRMGAAEPAGGLFTSVADLARFAAFGLGHASILGAESLAESQTPEHPSFESSAFALGWVVSKLPAAGEIIGHNGSTLHYGAFLAVHPDYDIGVVCLIGSGVQGDLAGIISLGRAALIYLIDPQTAIVPKASTTLAEAIETVGERLLLLATDPTASRIEEAFTPWQLADDPDGLLDYLADVADLSGGCASYEVREDRGFGAFIVRLDCAAMDWTIDVVAETRPPYRIDGIGIYPGQ